MAKYVNKPAEEIADAGKARLIKAFVKTKKTTKYIMSRTDKGQADKN